MDIQIRSAQLWAESGSDAWLCTSLFSGCGAGLLLAPILTPFLPASEQSLLGNVIAATYFPTLIEILVAVGIASYWLLGFTLGVRYLSLYKSPKHS